MSGLVKGVKKVFKKIGKVVKKIAKPLLIAAAVYFTAGLALSAMPATASFAASLPGFAGGGILGTGVGAGASAGTGIFSTVASKIGLGGGLVSGAEAVGGATTFAYGANSAAAAAGGGASAAAAKVGMSLTDKLLLAKVGTDVAGGLFGQSPEEEYAAQFEEQKRWRGAFYGVNADGSGPEVSNTPNAPEITVPEAPAQSGNIPPQQQQIMAGREKRELFPTSGSPEQADGGNLGVMQTNIQPPDGLFSAQEGVRYVG